MDEPAFHLRHWSDDDRAAFAAMQRDAAVMADLGGPFTRADSDAKFDRYRHAWSADGISRWVVADPAGAFLGYAGVMKRIDPNHPLGTHYEIGWRFCRDAWGRGYATASARRALHHAWTVVDADEILSYTAADNQRSRNVMAAGAQARCGARLHRALRQGRLVGVGLGGGAAGGQLISTAHHTKGRFRID